LILHLKFIQLQKETKPSTATSEACGRKARGDYPSTHGDCAAAANTNSRAFTLQGDERWLAINQTIIRCK
jgi:hypothetical protein